MLPFCAKDGNLGRGQVLRKVALVFVWGMSASFTLPYHLSLCMRFSAKQAEHQTKVSSTFLQGREIFHFNYELVRRSHADLHPVSLSPTWQPTNFSITASAEQLFCYLLALWLCRIMQRSMIRWTRQLSFGKMGWHAAVDLGYPKAKTLDFSL